MVFFGEYQVSLTGGGRVVLPKKLRGLLKGNSFVLSKGFDACLAGYDQEDWESRSKELLQVSLLERENLEKRRFLFASASFLEIDEQGRFVVPKHLYSYAGLEGKITIVGVGDHFEIWNPEKWQAYVEGMQS